MNNLPTNFALSVACGVCLTVSSLAQQLESAAVRNDALGRQPELVLKERGAHHRKYERVIEEVRPRGEVRRRVEPAYTELASGLHYWEDGEWKETEEVVEVFSGGAVARKGPHKVIFAPNLATLGAIDLETPDGLRLRSHVLGLSYYDSASGKGALIAEVKDSPGKVLPPNQVIYEDAFAGVQADVRLTYTRAGFEQDIILRAKLPRSPEDFGLNPATTRLVVMTEFVNPPRAETRTLSELTTRTSAGTTANADVAIRFGSMEIGRGQAFELGERKALVPLRGQVPVMKRWLKVDGRDLLLEEVPLPAVREHLEKLPDQSAVETKLRRTWVAQWELPAAPKPLAERKPMLTASVAATAPGYVLDYALVNASITNFTFQGDTTYYVNGGVNLYGTTTIEGGTVIKFNPPVDGFLYQNNGSIVCRTGPYRPAVFTSKNDNSVGETISGSTGTPTCVGDWNYYLAVDGMGHVNLSHIRMAYGYCGVTAMNGSVTLTDAQFLHFAWPVYLVNAGTNYLRNILMYDTAYPFEFYQSHANVEHLTAHQVSTFGFNDWQATLALTNCLLVNVTNLGNIPLTTNAVAITNGMGVFQSALGGRHYLPTNSVYRNAGTTNLNADLLARLAVTTTEAPVVYTNQTVAQPTNFPVRVARDTNAPDLGYHYEPFDYVFGGCHFNTNITFNAGVAVGWFRTSSGWYHAGHGIHMGDRQILTFDGTMEAPA